MRPGPSFCAFELTVHRDDDAVAWCAAVPVDASEAPARLARLSPSDRERAAGFPRRKRRAEFISARVLLADMVESHLHVAPDDWALTGQAGPPLVETWPTTDAPTISLSHAGGWVAAVVATTAKAGVDLELDGRENPRIADYLGWKLRPAGAAFTRAWTLWEATAKALHTGVFQRRNEAFEALAEPFINATTFPVVADDWLAANARIEADLTCTLVLAVSDQARWRCEVTHH